MNVLNLFPLNVYEKLPYLQLGLFRERAEPHVEPVGQQAAHIPHPGPVFLRLQICPEKDRGAHLPSTGE